VNVFKTQSASVTRPARIIDIVGDPPPPIPHLLDRVLQYCSSAAALCNHFLARILDLDGNPLLSRRWDVQAEEICFEPFAEFDSREDMMTMGKLLRQDAGMLLNQGLELWLSPIAAQHLPQLLRSLKEKLWVRAN
jgi:hypothetical protein